MNEHLQDLKSGGRPMTKLELANKEIEELKDETEKLTKEWLKSQEKRRKAIEYIYENIDLQHDGDDYGYMEWVDLKTNTQDFVETLLDILKEGDKE